MALLLALSGCSLGPEYPLLSPASVAGGFGWSEAALGDDHYRIAYTTPPQPAGVYGGPHPAAADYTRNLALDMALWRGAQLAEARGFAGYRVTDRRTDLSVYPDPLDYYDAGPPYWDPFWHEWRYTAGPFGYYPPLAPRARATAQAVIDLQLVQQLQPGDYAAGETIARLRQTYPGADGAPPS